MRKITVELGDRSYPIFIGKGILQDVSYFLPWIKSQQLMCVTNSTLASLYPQSFKHLSGKIGKVDQVVLPDGEKHKNLETLNLIFDALLQKKHNRSTTLLAFGGGVVGDMTGFAAACYQRGVDFIQVPTTLLSQVDSSVGGKTGVNHVLGKNMIGAFHQPKCVVIDTDILKTLPDRELSAGMAEVIKYGLIADYDFFVWLEQNIEKLMGRDDEALATAIQRSCEIKADVVAADEREGGVRAILNLGHTFGHAIEAHQGYGNWLHGEAVAVGMMLACRMSNKLGWIDDDIVDRARTLIRAANLPVEAPHNMNSADFLDYMSVDKKVLDGSLRLILLKACGKAVVSQDFEQQALMSTLPN